MKNWLIPATLCVLMIVQACGPSEEERQQQQAENERIINEKVNEIMQKLEEPSTSQTISDSAAVDSTAQVD